MKWFTWKSKIHGVGIYTYQELPKDSIIDIAIDENENITEFGSKINHSFMPNSRLVKYNNQYYIVSLCNIKPFVEITVNYNYSPSFIMKAHDYNPPLK